MPVRSPASFSAFSRVRTGFALALGVGESNASRRYINLSEPSTRACPARRAAVTRSRLPVPHVCFNGAWPASFANLSNSSVHIPREPLLKLRTRNQHVRKGGFSSRVDSVDDSSNDPDELLSLITRDLTADSYLLPSGGHRVMVIQLDFKWGPKRMKPGAAEHKMAESCALIHSIHGWKVVKQCIVPLKHGAGRRRVFGTGKFAELAEMVGREADVTAVFLDVEMLNAEQLKTLQDAWNMPVYDRYTVVLQIFQLYARTREAQLQVALAEIPYLKSRLHGMHDSSLTRQKGALLTVGGSGETLLSTRLQLLKENEAKLKQALAKIQERRQLLRSQRKKLDLPVVAVVGYTNAGKTSIIKALTRDEKLAPENRLFATLDVTAHQGVLPSGLPVIYMDTVGFISDIPTTLIAAFSATLEDVAHADVIMHLRDISNPDSEQQKLSVLASLGQLGLPASLLQNVVEVCSKADLVSPEQLRERLPPGDGGCALVSAATGEGLGELKRLLESTVIGVTGRVQLRLKLAPTGEELSWLHREGTVRDVQTDSEGWLIVDVLLSKQALGRYRMAFERQA